MMRILSIYLILAAFCLQSCTDSNKTPDEGLRECQRIKSFEARFTSNTENIDIESIKAVLRARDSESRDVVSNSNTYASVIYDLGGQSTHVDCSRKTPRNRIHYT